MRKLLILIVFLTLCLFSCVETTTNNNVLILNGEEITIELGETVQLNAKHNFESENSYNWYALNSCVKLEKNGKITGIKEGSCEVFVEIDGCKDSIMVKIINKPQITLTLTIESNELFIGEKTTLNLEINPKALCRTSIQESLLSKFSAFLSLSSVKYKLGLFSYFSRIIFSALCQSSL